MSGVCLEVASRFSGIYWRVSGRRWERVRKVFGTYPDGSWRIFGMCQEGNWKESGQCLKIIWKVSGKF